MRQRLIEKGSGLALFAATAASVALIVSAVAMWTVLRVAETSGTVVAQALQPSAAVEARWPPNGG
jgi:hypothetical protein